jgi:hypothetical protein
MWDFKHTSTYTWSFVGRINSAYQTKNTVALAHEWTASYVLIH